MSNFKQPILSNDKDQLKNRLTYADIALSHWKERLNKDSEYEKGFIQRNIEYFSKQVDNINKKINEL